MATLQHLSPVTSVQSFYQVGDLLSDSDFDFDGISYRYAVLDMAGVSWRPLLENQASTVDLLGFRLRTI